MNKLITKILDFIYRRFFCYVVVCAATEQVFLSRRLWRKIISSIPEGKRGELRVFFEKYPVFVYPGNGNRSAIRYRFFVNTDLTNVRTPDGGEPFTSPIEFGRYGHVGFQAAQPTVAEVLTEYGMADSQFFLSDDYTRRIRLRVECSSVNGEPCYVITTRSLGAPY